MTFLAGTSMGDMKFLTNSGTVGSGTPGTVVTSGAANTYGSVTELISSGNNTMRTFGISITAMETGASATTSGASLDILVGGATDDTLISSLLVGWVTGGPARNYFFPVEIPSGVRIAAKIANETASVATNVIVHCYGGMESAPWPTGRKVTTYGTKNNSATGATISPAQSGATATATQMTASSSEDHFYFLPGFEPYNDTTLQNRNYAVSIGVGAATEEKIGTWWFGFDAGEKGNGPLPPTGVWRQVASGTRLTLVTSNSGTNDATYGGLIYACS